MRIGGRTGAGAGAAAAVVLGAWLSGCPARPELVVADGASAASASAPGARAAEPGSRPTGASWSAHPASVRPGEEAVLAALGPQAVVDASPARRVLYTWTSDEQARVLRMTRTLLQKGSNDGPGMSRYDTELWSLYGTDPWARLLMNPPFHRARYAWPNAWSTRLGADAHSYGDVLVRIELKPEAITVGFFPEREPAARWVFWGPDGRVMTAAEALRQAGQVGAVLHERGQAAGYNGAVWREFIVCNEAMIASWSVATEEVRAELTGAQAMLDLLARQTRGRPGWTELRGPEGFGLWQREAVQAWAEPGPPSIERAYASSLAFATPRYQPAEATWTELRESLGKALAALETQGPALRFSPGVTPPGRLAVPPPVPPRPRRPCIPRGTFGCSEPANLPCRSGSGAIVPCPA